MKRLLAFAPLALCLFAMSALAQTVPDQVAAPARATGTWHSPSGRTTVTLDAEVIVPDVSAMPIVEVFPRIFEPMEAYGLADALIGKGAWQAFIDLGGNTQRIDDMPRPDYQTGIWHGSGLHYHSLDLGGGGNNAQNLPLKLIFASYTDAGILGETPVLVWMNYRYKAGDNQGRNVGALQDAVALTTAVVTGIWPDFQFYAVDKELDMLPNRISHEDKPADYGYRVYFARMLHGVAVTPVMQQGAGDANYFFPDKSQPSYHLPLPYEFLYADVGEDGIFQVRYDNPLRIGQALSASAALLPFDRVLDIFGSVSALKYASFERASNNGIQIRRVVLGYMNLQMKDYPGRYQMVPVWDFFGSRSIDREFFNSDNDSLFTINAVDGTVIDRYYGY